MYAAELLSELVFEASTPTDLGRATWDARVDLVSQVVDIHKLGGDPETFGGLLPSHGHDDGGAVGINNSNEVLHRVNP